MQFVISLLTQFASGEFAEKSNWKGDLVVNHRLLRVFSTHPFAIENGVFLSNAVR